MATKFTYRTRRLKAAARVPAKGGSPACFPEARGRQVLRAYRGTRPRLVQGGAGEHGSHWAAIGSVAAKIGCTAETLRLRVRRAGRDGGKRARPKSEERDRIKALERENRELRQANEILRTAPANSALAELMGPMRARAHGTRRPPVQATIAFIDDHPGTYGVEPICRVLPIVPSTCHARISQRADPAPRSARSQRDAMLRAEMRRIHAENLGA